MVTAEKNMEETRKDWNSVTAEKADMGCPIPIPTAPVIKLL